MVFVIVVTAAGIIFPAKTGRLVKGFLLRFFFLLLTFARKEINVKFSRKKKKIQRIKTLLKYKKVKKIIIVTKRTTKFSKGDYS